MILAARPRSRVITILFAFTVAVAVTSTSMSMTMGMTMVSAFCSRSFTAAMHNGWRRSGVAAAESGMRLFAASSSQATAAAGKNKNLWTVEECIDAFQGSDKDDVVFIDASYFHKGGRKGRAEYLEGPRIPRSHFLDLEDIVTSKALYPDLNPKDLYSTFPPPSLFAATMDAMGVTQDKQVIVYGRQGCHFTPRTWYLIRTYGGPNQRVGLMQGSLDEWIELGGEVDATPMESYDVWAKDLFHKADEAAYPVANDAKERFVDMMQVVEMIEQNGDEDTAQPKTNIIDTRGSSFASKGHMPGATHVPYSSLTESDNSLKLKPAEDLRAILKDAGIGEPDDKSKVLLTCGSCVSVCHVALAMEECGYDKPLLYDGSWNEYGRDPDTPKIVPDSSN